MFPRTRVFMPPPSNACEQQAVSFLRVIAEEVVLFLITRCNFMTSTRLSRTLNCVAAAFTGRLQCWTLQESCSLDAAPTGSRVATILEGRAQAMTSRRGLCVGAGSRGGTLRMGQRLGASGPLVT